MEHYYGVSDDFSNDDGRQIVVPELSSIVTVGNIIASFLADLKWPSRIFSATINFNYFTGDPVARWAG